MHEELRVTVRQFISENFLFGDGAGAFSDEDSFLEAGIMDSTGVLELISFLEGQYSVQVADDEMVPENFDSVSRIVGYLERKLASGLPVDEAGTPVGPLSALPSYAS